jgi:hypothetical protein
MRDPMAQVAAQMLAALIASPAGREYTEGVCARIATEGNGLSDQFVALRDELAHEAVWLACALEQATKDATK